MAIANETLLAPASVIQEQFWLTNRLNPGNSAYNIPVLFSVSGGLDTDALSSSLQTLIARHQILRTTFWSEKGKLFQYIHKNISFAINIKNLADRKLNNDHAEPRELIQTEIDRPFDLSEGPLLRCSLILHSNKNLLLFVMHHIIIDLRSYELFFGELSELYNNFSKDKTYVPLEKESAQYVEYAKWQRKWIGSDGYDKMLNYWSSKLFSRENYLDIPSEKRRPPVHSFKGGIHKFEFKNDLVVDLIKLAKQKNVNLFLILITSYAVLLSKYSAKHDITIGVPFTNRRKNDFKNTIGCFVNILPQTFIINNDINFDELLHQVRVCLLESHRNQEVPYELIVNELHPVRDPSYTPIFQHGFTYQTPPQIQFDGLTVEEEQINHTGVQMDTFAVLCEKQDSVSGFIEFYSDVYGKSLIERLVTSWETLLISFIKEQDRPLAQLSAISQSDKQQIAIWNSTKRDYPTESTLQSIFEAQAEKTPSRAALVFGNAIMSYHELNTKANRLARYLRDKGVGPDVLVGICMERSFELVLGIYGIIKSGGAYVPFDPELPEERLLFLYRDTKTKIILTQSHLLENLLILQNDTEIICLDQEWPSLECESEENLPQRSGANNLAYVIYTSGSTGRPKGVMNEHGGICNRLFWMQEEFRLQPTDSVLQKTPFSFDVSVWEFFWPLQAGARLVIAPPNIHLDQVALIDNIINNNITTIHFVPSLLQAFLDTKQSHRCRCLKRVICSGESLPHALQHKFFDNLDAELHNLYGPTEAAVDVTHWRCRPNDELHTVPIGYPIANTQIYISDRNLNLASIGVPGEIIIGGVQVARGYLNRPDLTDKQFIPDIFSKNTHGRLYKTGDLARYLSDGSIEYLGRFDDQVKINGVRIELGEIEAKLTEHHAVQQAAVITSEGPAGDRKLSAFIVLENEYQQKSQEVNKENTASPQAIHKFLSLQLPRYMMPYTYTFIDNIPLTSSGKLDRKKLTTLICSQSTKNDKILPANDIERYLREIWQDLLKNNEISVHDNFFDIGGSSLLIMFMATKIKEKLGNEFPVVKLFQYPTIHSFARYLQYEAKSSVEIDYLVERRKKQQTAMTLSKKRSLLKGNNGNG